MKLAVHRLCRDLGAFALRDVSLSVDDGSYAVLLGPSGCGKSVLLATLAGLAPAEAGTIAVGPRDVTSTPPERRNVGLVFQNAALFPHRSVQGNVAYGLVVRRVAEPERSQRVAQVIQALGLEPILGRPVATLSGGEAQRVAIARALAPRPDVLLLDEPLSLLDHNARIAMQAELKRLHRALGLTTLHVTHSRDEALALGDACAVMAGGRILQSGPIDDVFGRPGCPWVASFLGLDPATASGPCDGDCAGAHGAITGRGTD